MNFTDTENLVDFGLGLYAKEYYEAAQVLKANGSKGAPYHLMLAISAECFLKSIRTTMLWYRGSGVKVNHTKKTHDLTTIFHKLECNHPQDAEFLKNSYMSKYSRSFKEDLELNKNVFTLRRSPYSQKGEVPRPLIPSSRDELLYGCKYENDIAVYESQLEDVTESLYDVVVPHIIS
ncbi:hypothetical protein [Vibrio splendidus]|uniref:hypothetical protein n=1 Tax=Vibrio splendidus TaxID=29497 RepID=UPI00352EF39C